MAEVSPIVQVLEDYRRLLDRQDAAAMKRLVGAYRQIYGRLKTLIDALMFEIGDNLPTPGQLTRMSRYKDLLSQVDDELRAYGVIVANETETVGRAGMVAGQNYAREVLSTVVAGDASIAGAWNKLPVETIETLLAFLQPTSPLYQSLKTMGEVTREAVAQTIIEMVALGKNPRVIAAAIRDSLAGGLTSALRTVRTAQNWAYREAARANFLANSDVVTGWVWHAHIGPRTCISCIAMHGTVHPMTEPLRDHLNGRCAAIPIVRGYENIVKIGDGETWLRDQPENVQKQIMGRGKWEAWRDGKVDINQMSTDEKIPNEIYGRLRVVPTNKDLGI